jgi:hypothetical protein
VASLWSMRSSTPHSQAAFAGGLRSRSLDGYYALEGQLCGQVRLFLPLDPAPASVMFGLEAQNRHADRLQLSDFLAVKRAGADKQVASNALTVPLKAR